VPRRCRRDRPPSHRRTDDAGHEAGGYDATVIGGTGDRGGRYIAPTVLAGVKPDAAVMDDEILNGSGQGEDGERAKSNDNGQEDHRPLPELHSRDLGQGINETEVDAGCQQHGAPADARNKIGHAHQQAAEGGAG